MRKPSRQAVRSWHLASSSVLATLLIGGMSLPVETAGAAPAPPSLAISQVPLTVVQPTHPQVLIAIGNSESMDGNLSGAIMTGSGSLGSDVATLTNSSSLINFTIPAGFTPPLNAGSAGSAPYTVSSGGTLYDNSPSRLNVAKASIQAVINQYIPSTDFGLMAYATTGTSLYTTWVYHMSATGGFTFTNTVPANVRYVANPCFNYTSASTTVQANCGSIAGTLFDATTLSNSHYMIISASSDDPNINDVLYAPNVFPSVSVTYGTRTPTNPYTYYSLAQYNSGSVLSTYASALPTNGIRSTTPTNAGYVPFSDQVMYVQRGFGYGALDAVTGGAGRIVTSGGSAIVTAGQTPTAASVAAAIGSFSAALAPETNNPNSSEIKALAGQSALAGLLTSAGTTLASSLPAIGQNCTPPKQYVVLITDGLPTEDLAGKFWPPVGSDAAAGYGMTATFNADGSLNTGATNDQALIDTIVSIKALNAAGVATYVVGLGAGVDPTKNPQAAATLTAMSIAGGTDAAAAQITGGTRYFPATDPGTLVADLQNILANIASQSSSSSAAAANSTSLNTSSQVYQATFVPGSIADNAWTGDLKAYAIDTSATISSTARWSARQQLDSMGMAGRHIATWDPYYQSSSSSPVVPTAVGFSLSNLSANLQTALAKNGNNATDILNYIRGDHSREQSNGGPLRNRTHLLGDIVDSAPVFVGPAGGPYPDASYATFASSSTVKGRRSMLYFGANDGMLHGVDASSGQEVMGYIPYGGTGGVFSNLYELADPYYLSHHLFFVDGSPQVADVLLSSDGKWHTLLVGGENAGGRSIYALDVTNPNSFTTDNAVASSVLWELTDTDMGLSYSTPVVVRSNAVAVTDASNSSLVKGFAVLFGNGYNSARSTPFFYAVNATTGAVLAKIDLCAAVSGACNSSQPNGLSSIAAANSSGVAGVPQDMAYAGDLQGNLWTINMSNSNPANWTVTLLFQARDSANNAQPITTAPALTPNPNFPQQLGIMAFVGTGALLTQADLTNTDVQTIYGVWDNTSSLSSYPAGTAPTLPYTRANLAQQTVSVVTANFSGTNVNALTLTNNPVNLTYAPLTVSNPAPPPTTLTVTPKEGWYFDLSPIGNGTRSFTPLSIDGGGVKLNTNTPPASACAQPYSYFMNVNFRTGGPMPTASIGLPNGGTGIGSATVNGAPTVLAGVLASDGYSSQPASMQSASGTDVNVISTAKGLKTVSTLGFQPARVGWWQVQ
ncbi:pilus assembly protein [Dyella japonica]|uniref:Type IV pilus assembly protein PilY1 n=1 Tax=Dyella japonica TaxID=231455 RepID=A0ABV2K408_9GAMM